MRRLKGAGFSPSRSQGGEGSHQGCEERPHRDRGDDAAQAGCVLGEKEEDPHGEDRGPEAQDLPVVRIAEDGPALVDLPPRNDARYISTMKAPPPMQMLPMSRGIPR